MSTSSSCKGSAFLRPILLKPSSTSSLERLLLRFFTPPAFISLLLLFFFFFFSCSHLFSNLHSSSYLFIINLLRLFRFVNFFQNSYRKGLIPDIKRFFFLVISFFDSGSSFLFLVLLVWLCRFNFKLVFRHTVFSLLVRHVLRSYSHDRMYILLLYFLVGAEWPFNGCFGFLNFIHLVWLRFCRKRFMNLSLVLIFFFLKLQKIVLLLIKNNSLLFLFPYLLPCQLFFLPSQLLEDPRCRWCLIRLKHWYGYPARCQSLQCAISQTIK